MRPRDLNKVVALRQATLEVVNEDGFATSSIQKIAKRAGVSPATLYIYMKNKEELLVSTFMEIKAAMAQQLMAEFDASLPIKTSLEGFWSRLYTFVHSEGEKYRFIDQFTYSPYIKLIDTALLEAPYQPLHQALDRAIAAGEIVDCPKAMLLSFVLAPPVFLARSRLNKGFRPSAQEVDAAFQLAWKAISR
ncbi:TetR/AcrR family transcriptional regulator [Pokkaliibacter sp. CJK22405]|uniref:TetR/AcrR family transcriptional regulator n=1 Tax=Pokkaliibacter sp. CJK22405 TaxID=3384615 RepID=UPI003984E2AE